MQCHFLLSCLVVGTTILLPARAIKAQEIRFGVDGETWIQFDTTDVGRLKRVILLRGIYDGLLFGRSPELNSYPVNASWETIIAGLDRFYTDFANRKVPVVLALQVLQLQLRGEPSAAVDSATAYNRCLWAGVGLGLTEEQARARRARCAKTARRPQ